MTQQRLEELELAARLLSALLQGPVTCYRLPPRLYMHDMYKAVQCLNSMGIKVERIDAGGTPTWDLV
jgi:hypothetical protein